MEDLTFAIQIFVIGFLVVMVTLFGLYIILLLFNRFMYKPGTESTESKVASDSREALHITSATAVNGRVVAAILAAVYNYMQSGKEQAFTGPIRIAVQQASGAKGKSWKYTGRKELLVKSLELENIRREKKHKNIQNHPWQ